MLQRAMLSTSTILSRHVLSFLAPALLRPSNTACRPFSASAPLLKRSPNKQGIRGVNRHRGTSAMRRTGLRYPLSVSKEPLPEPVMDPEKRSKVTVREDHGLWDFFTKTRKAPITPSEMSEYGRAWTVQELRYKSFEDLHCLWWVCLKEMNRIRTLEHERDRIEAGYGKQESEYRIAEIKKTQKSIKWALTERWYAWEDAKRIERTDPELAAQLMGVPADSFVDEDVDDEQLPPGEQLQSSDFDPDTPQPRQPTQ